MNDPILIDSLAGVTDNELASVKRAGSGGVGLGRVQEMTTAAGTVTSPRRTLGGAGTLGEVQVQHLLQCKRLAGPAEDGLVSAPPAAGQRSRNGVHGKGSFGLLAAAHVEELRMRADPRQPHPLEWVRAVLGSDSLNRPPGSSFDAWRRPEGRCGRKEHWEREVFSLTLLIRLPD